MCNSQIESWISVDRPAAEQILVGNGKIIISTSFASSCLPPTSLGAFTGIQTLDSEVKYKKAKSGNIYEITECKKHL